MKTLAACWKRLTRRAPQPDFPWRDSRSAGVERLEARIAPATVAALPGNASFEETLDFSKWTIDSGPGSLFLEYLPENVETTVVRGGLAPEGNAYAHLSFEGRVISGTDGFGPSLQSETFTVTANDQISVTWRATNNGDTAHPRGRLFAADGTPVATFFDADTGTVGSSRVDLQACKLEYSIVSPK